MAFIADVETIISVKSVVFFLGFLMLITLIATYHYRPEDLKHSRFSVFLTVTTSITVVLLGISLIVSAIGFEHSERITKTTLTKEAIDKLWLYPNQLMVNSKHARPEFIKSLNYNNVAMYNAPDSQEPPSVQTLMEEQNITIVITQAWEDYLSLRSVEKMDDQEWICNFIQWAQSPYLYENFAFLKYNNKETTTEFSNLLFEYAKRLPIPTTEESMYQQIVTDFLKDPRLIALFKKCKMQ